jgi:hypothetical protein
MIWKSSPQALSKDEAIAIVDKTDRIRCHPDGHQLERNRMTHQCRAVCLRQDKGQGGHDIGHVRHGSHHGFLLSRRMQLHPEGTVQ